MATLTPEIARDLMIRSMTTGAPTAEFNRYGGYNAVASMYNQSGGTYSLADIPAERKQQLAQTIAQTGVGNLSLLKETNTPLTAAGRDAMVRNGVTSFGADALTERGIPFEQTTGEQLGALQTQYGALQTQYGALQKQLTEMQSQYDRLVAQYGRQGGLGTGGIVGGSLVPFGGTPNSGQIRGGEGIAGGSLVPFGGSSFNFGQTGTGETALGSTGKVYGPDGKEYSSPAAAVAAGVANFTYARPLFNIGLINAATLNSNPFLQSLTGGNNVSSGAATFNQNPQLFSLGAPQLGARSANKNNPFAG
jgi:hypothetical protein